MSARMMKKVLKEQEAAVLQQQQINSDDDSESVDSPRPTRNNFDLLDLDNDDGDDEDDHQYHNSDQEKCETANETINFNVSKKYSSTEKAAGNAALIQNVKSTKKKKDKKKKKKTKEDSIRNTESVVRSSNKMLEDLTLGASSSDYQPKDPNSAKLKSAHVDRDDKKLKKHYKSSILQVDPKFLSAENELKRIFGSRVVKSYERSNLPVNSRQHHGSRRGVLNLKKTLLVSPSQHWPHWDGSLTMELLETKDGVHYFRYVHSSSYAQAQRAFEAAKAIHDLNGIASILLNHPYHIDSLIVLADYFKFTGEHQMSADATAKCLYAMECAWHPLFTPSQNCQLKYSHDANKPLFSSLFTHMKNMDRRGCHRSALEICKLLLSLDPDDPMGAMFCIDYYALRAEEYMWLEQFSAEYRSDNSLWLFPNLSYSLAICRFYLERSENVNQEESHPEKAASTDLMKQALMLHPSVLKKLAAKVPLKERIWTNVIEHRFFKSEQTGNPSVDHLISIYVERSYLIWRLPDLQKFMYEAALAVMELLKEQGSDADDWACVRNEAFSLEKNEYSHLLISDFSDSMPTLPPDNLQDFMVAPRNVVENHQHIPDNHTPPDFSNRNALAVLFESMLPWINYGAGDGADAQQHHLPDDDE